MEEFEQLENTLEKLRVTRDRLLSLSSWEEFHDWLNSHENKKLKRYGIKRSTIENGITVYNRLSNKIKKGQSIDTNDLDFAFLKKIPDYQEKGDILFEAVNLFLSEIPNTEPFLGKTWFVYFFHIGDRSSEPKLGKAVLEGIETNTIKITNLPGIKYRNYFGNYRKLNDHVLVMDLWNKEKNRNLHIKVYYAIPHKDEIMLGSYLTFTNNHIVRGSILLVKGTREMSPNPGLLSFRTNPDTFYNVSSIIRRYLLSKRHNYYKAPRDIHTLEELSKFLNGHEENWESRFIEEYIPKLFISSPGLSIGKEAFSKNKEVIDKILGRINTSLNDLVKINIYNNQTPIKDLNPRTLFLIKKTRFFVLIHTKTDKGSYSLVQLGWALAHCKSVMIIYEKGSISDHIFTLSSQVQRKVFSNLAKEWPDISSFIEDNVMKNLKPIRENYDFEDSNSFT